ncbi:carbohydrate ABC transporter permease [Phytoactinopolyspora halotolerans]|uniref:Carbohydrate ABC transporter permease n=1 Tax=Phytoactinopolyspora halotolerans TaxID=1981512 RepID=A0A6L9SBR8_9ACTN|nr:carbohydrate ABC transporter permease [Phytoactinopolyspora halotolerans]NEE01991.1 carbohydrate ABC transporter permease [Phytoactinopolyspora halotolerans]
MTTISRPGVDDRVRSHSAPARRNTKPRRAGVTTACWYVAVVALSVVTVAPLVWTLSTALKPAGEILGGALNLIPENPTLQNFREAFTAVPFARYLLNSLIIGVGGAVTNVFFGGLGGYALAKLNFRGRKALFALFLSSLMIPGIVTMIPSFLILRYFPLAGGNDLLGQGGLGLINTYWAVLLPGAAGAFAVFFMKQFFETLPDELGEAARIDGASEFRIFAQIYFPLAKAGLAVLAILTFQAGWNNFLWPLIVLNNQEMMTVQVGLASFVNNYETNFGPLMAGTVLASLPVLAVFIVAQRYIIEGVAHVGSR